MKMKIKALVPLFIALSLVASLTIAPTSHAQSTSGKSGIALALMLAGGASALGGILVLVGHEDERCRAGFASHEDRCVSTDAMCASNPNAPVCTETIKSERDNGLGVALLAGGVGAIALGYSMRPGGALGADVFRDSFASGFAIRPTGSGVMLSKTWEF